VTVCRTYELTRHSVMEEFSFAEPPELVRVDGLHWLRAVDRDDFIARCRQWFLGTPSVVEQVTFPATWWDAFKERWFPLWLRRLSPVSFRTVRMERFCAYPEIPRPQGRGHFTGLPVLLRNDSEWRESVEELIRDE